MLKLWLTTAKTQICVYHRRAILSSWTLQRILLAILTTLLALHMFLHILINSTNNATPSPTKRTTRLYFASTVDNGSSIVVVPSAKTTLQWLFPKQMTTTDADDDAIAANDNKIRFQQQLQQSISTTVASVRCRGEDEYEKQEQQHMHKHVHMFTNNICISSNSNKLHVSIPATTERSSILQQLDAAGGAQSSEIKYDWYHSDDVYKQMVTTTSVSTAQHRMSSSSRSFTTLPTTTKIVGTNMIVVNCYWSEQDDESSLRPKSHHEYIRHLLYSIGQLFSMSLEVDFFNDATSTAPYDAVVFHQCQDPALTTELSFGLGNQLTNLVWKYAIQRGAIHSRTKKYYLPYNTHDSSTLVSKRLWNTNQSEQQLKSEICTTASVLCVYAKNKHHDPYFLNTHSTILQWQMQINHLYDQQQTQRRRRRNTMESQLLSTTEQQQQRFQYASSRPIANQTKCLNGIHVGIWLPSTATGYGNVRISRQFTNLHTVMELISNEFLHVAGVETVPVTVSAGVEEIASVLRMYDVLITPNGHHVSTLVVLAPRSMGILVLQPHDNKNTIPSTVSMVDSNAKQFLSSYIVSTNHTPSFETSDTTSEREYKSCRYGDDAKVIAKLCPIKTQMKYLYEIDMTVNETSLQHDLQLMLWNLCPKIPNRIPWGSSTFETTLREEETTTTTTTTDEFNERSILPPQQQHIDSPTQNPDGWIILLEINLGFYDFFLNWLHHYVKLMTSSSFEENTSTSLPPPIVLLAQDDVVYNKVMNDVVPKFSNTNIRMTIERPPPTEMFLSETTTGGNESATTNTADTVHDYNTPGYIAMVSGRATRILNKLQQGYNVLYTDTDSVWQHNPLPYFGSAGRSTGGNTAGVDVVLQVDADSYSGFGLFYCTGLFGLVSNPSTIDLVAEWKKSLRLKSQVNQQAFNVALYRNSRVNHQALPFDIFPNGKAFFDEFSSMQRATTVVVHNNYIVGYDAKKKRFQDYGLWDTSLPSKRMLV